LQWSRWREDLKTPGNLIGVAGVIVAFTTWYLSQQTAEISLKIVQIPVLNTGQVGPLSSSFTVFDNKGQRISSNIYAADIAIWNSGNIELGASKIRRPLTAKFDGKVQILDRGIGPVTDPIAEVVASDPEENSTEIRWRYFDPGTGFHLRIIYASDKQQELTLSANILGVKLQQYTEDYRIGWKSLLKLFGMALIVLPLAVFFLILPSKYLERQTYQGYKQVVPPVVFLIGIGLCVLIAVAFAKLVNIFPPEPPI
jgi:hypothetical protein